MDKITTVPTFAEAFVKLQAAIRPAIKDSTNPHFKSRYADLNAIWEAVRGPLFDHGFGVIQMPQFEGDSMFLETVLLHVSGDKVTGRYPLRPVKPDPQGFGSAISYAKRYSLAAMLGVVAEDDDDGEGASGRGKPNGNGHKQPEPNGLPDQRTDAPEPDPDIRNGTQNWVEKQEAKLLACTDVNQMTEWLNKYATYSGRTGSWERPTPGSDLDKLLKHFPDLFRRLKSYYLEKLREV